MKVLFLLKPALLSGKNSLLRRQWTSSALARDTVVLFLVVAMCAGIYRGTLWIFAQLNQDQSLIYLPPGLPLGIVLMLLIFMLLLSNIVSAMGNFFFAEDLDLLRAAPLRPSALYSARFLATLTSSSWMSLVFILPLILGVAAAFPGPLLRILPFLIALPLYFTIIAACALSISTLVIWLLPPQRARYLFHCCALLLLLGLCLLMQQVRARLGSAHDSSQISRVLSTVSAANADWLPSNWLAEIAQESIQPTGKGVLLHFSLLLSSTLAALAFSYLILRLLHLPALTRIQGARTQGMRGQESAQAPLALPLTAPKVAPKPNERLRALLSSIVPPSPLRALIQKETRFVAREMTSSLQLLVIVCLLFAYLSNITIFSNLDEFGGRPKQWWRSIFFMLNWSVGSFFSIGLCTRLVFPSISLEGKCFWILQSSPLSCLQLLRSRMLTWYWPVALLSAVLLGTGAAAVGVGARIALVNGLAGLCIAWGVVGLATGIGARFANFSWEHASQLAMSFGSLVFMLTSVGLVFINITVLWYTLFALPNLGILEPQLARWIFPLEGLLLLWGINFLCTRFALRWGQRGLEARMG
jgi:ABC-2 type transport system permease protein